MKNSFLSLVFLFITTCFYGQQQVRDSVQVKEPVIEAQKVTWNTDPLSPARAAFYSAIFPGLGQAYNKSYWKVPIVWGAIGTGVYFYIRNSKEFDRYQDAYKSRLAGKTDDEFWGDRADGQPRLSTEGLRHAQKFYTRNKELSLLITVGLYALNIIEANVDAHLKQFNVDERLSIEPYLKNEDLTLQPEYGLVIKFNF